MRVAALYDIHGNLPALRAVLDEVEASGADLIVFGGDLAWGPLPRETMDAVMTLEDDALFLRGNADREVAAGAGLDQGLDPSIAAVNQWAAGELSPAQRTFLGELPDAVVVDVDGMGPVLFCHGSPRSDEETITTATPSDRVNELVADVEQETIVCGHTHAQFERRVGDKLVVNAGSVGLPFGRAAAPTGRSLVLGLSLRRTDYDYAATARLIREKNGPRSRGLRGPRYSSRRPTEPQRNSGARCLLRGLCLSGPR